MNPVTAFSINLVLTLSIAALLVTHLARSLFGVLVDLCGTEDRARFWLAFSRVLLIGMPAVTALGYRPGMESPEWYLDLASELSRNIMTLLVTVVGVGLVIAFFAAIAPRGRKEKTA
jgi:hypothetical protein